MTKKHTANKASDEVKANLHGFRTTPEIEKMAQHILERVGGDSETEKWHNLIKNIYFMWNGKSREQLLREVKIIKHGKTYCPQARTLVLLQKCEDCSKVKREACEEVKAEWIRTGYDPLSDHVNLE